MTSDHYQAVIDRLSAFIDTIEVDDIDYQSVIDYFTSRIGVILSDSYPINFSEISPRENNPGGSGHHLTRFKGELTVPEIEKYYTELVPMKKAKEGSLSGFALPFIVFPPFLFTYFGFPEPDLRREPVRRPVPVTRPVLVPDLVPEPNPKPVPKLDPIIPPILNPLPVPTGEKPTSPVTEPRPPLVWTPVAFETLTLVALLAIKKQLEGAKHVLEKRETWLVGVGIASAGIAAYFAIARLASRGPGWFKGVGMALLGIGTLATAQGAEEESRREGVLEKYAKINIDLNQVNQAIILKQLEEGKRDPMTKPYEIIDPGDHLDSTVKEFYDETDWFHDFPGDWSQMKQVYFTQEKVGIVDDNPKHSRIRVNPSMFYKQLEKQAESEQRDDENGVDVTQGWSATRKLYKISKAIEFFGNRSGMKPNGKFDSGYASESAAILYGEYEHVARYPHVLVKYTNRNPYYISSGKVVPQWIKDFGRHPDITDVDREHHPEISKKIQSNIIRDDDKQYERLRGSSRIQELPATNPGLDSANIRKINEALEDYILDAKRNKQTREQIIQEIQSLQSK